MYLIAVYKKPWPFSEVESGKKSEEFIYSDLNLTGASLTCHFDGQTKLLVFDLPNGMPNPISIGEKEKTKTQKIDLETYSIYKVEYCYGNDKKFRYLQFCLRNSTFEGCISECTDKVTCDNAGTFEFSDIDTIFKKFIIKGFYIQNGNPDFFGVYFG